MVLAKCSSDPRTNCRQQSRNLTAPETVYPPPPCRPYSAEWRSTGFSGGGPVRYPVCGVPTTRDVCIHIYAFGQAWFGYLAAEGIVTSLTYQNSSSSSAQHH